MCISLCGSFEMALSYMHSKCPSVCQNRARCAINRIAGLYKQWQQLQLTGVGIKFQSLYAQVGILPYTLRLSDDSCLSFYTMNYRKDYLDRAECAIFSKLALPRVLGGQQHYARSDTFIAPINYCLAYHVCIEML